MALGSDSFLGRRLMTIRTSGASNEVMVTAKPHADARGAEYYLRTAKSLRDRAPEMRYREARDELWAVALEYERLARLVELRMPAAARPRPR
jgi:hypothetical protein